MAGFDTLDGTRTSQHTVPAEPGDHDRLSHYVTKDQITAAMVEGTPAVALCGKVWVPSRDGTKFPVCPECAEIFERMPSW